MKQSVFQRAQHRYFDRHNTSISTGGCRHFGVSTPLDDRRSFRFAIGGEGKWLRHGGFVDKEKKTCCKANRFSIDAQHTTHCINRIYAQIVHKKLLHR
ncbi:MAG: hypothetical protein KBB11_04620 [Bacteroidales bacterium]|nr:hypothetical protein [Bacteroidales bacterium]